MRVLFPTHTEVAINRRLPPRSVRSISGVNDHDYNSLFSSLNDAIDILARNRTPDPAYIAAYDTLKQSRAMLVKVLNTAPDPAMDAARELAAA